jgi:hypothetical protein
MCVHMHCLVKLIPIERNLTWIADNRYPSEDGWLGWIRVRVVMDESMVLYPVDDGSVLGDLVTCRYRMH